MAFLMPLGFCYFAVINEVFGLEMNFFQKNIVFLIAV